MTYYLYDENDRLLAVFNSPVAAELYKADLQRREDLEIYIVKEEK